MKCTTAPANNDHAFLEGSIFGQDPRIPLHVLFESISLVSRNINLTVDNSGFEWMYCCRCWCILCPWCKKRKHVNFSCGIHTNISSTDIETSWGIKWRPRKLGLSTYLRAKGCIDMFKNAHIPSETCTYQTTRPSAARMPWDNEAPAWVHQALVAWILFPRRDKRTFPDSNSTSFLNREKAALENRRCLMVKFKRTIVHPTVRAHQGRRSSWPLYWKIALRWEREKHELEQRSKNVVMFLLSCTSKGSGDV